ncbi:SHOCT domain-containing protein [Salmonella enterica subsp. enterica serovar Typhimurium]|uniref:SHOCT domain-containing protein n=2 Tax=Salmonella enterica TaxID=28901 RepID=UPI0021587FF7|nr:SHOCT domain-containing protein [Salmonella enterica]MCR8603282.1 SHOCT domain-containing protein [Salmonella enterica subsp. enterica serovar Typhimurium]
MADTASLIARVKTEGARQAAQELDKLSTSANTAEGAVQKLTPAVEKTNSATSKAAGDGLSKFRNAAGQVGFQVQDMVVQLQSGTSAFVAIGQQGSQLAGAFGPGGAVLGAVIALASAVGGVLYKSLTSAEAGTKDLEAAQEQLKSTFQQTSSGTFELTDGLIQLTQISREAAETQLALAKANADIIAQQTAKAIQEDAKSWETWKASTSAAISQYDALVAKGADVGDTLEKLGGTYEGNIVGVNMLAQNIGELSDKFGVNREQALEMIAAQSAFNKEPTAENARRISDVFTEWLGTSKNLNPELVRLTKSANDNATALENAEKSTRAAAEAQKNLGNNVNATTQRLREQNDAIVKNQQIAILSDRERVKAQAQADKEAFAKREGVTKEQIAAYNAARDTEAQQDIARIDATEKAKTERVNAAAAKRESAQIKREETQAQRQKKAADDFLNTIARQNSDELAAIDAQEQQKLAKLQEFQQQGAISQEQFEAAKTQIAVDADAKRNEILAQQTEERMKKQFSADAYVAQMQALAEGEFAELDRQYEVKLQKLNDFHAQGLIAEETYQQTLNAMNDTYALDRAKATGTAFGNMASNIGSALGEASTAYKAFAIAQATIATYTSAIEAYKSTAAIPVVGPFLAPVAAAAAVAAGLANIGKIRSAREQGGSLAAGQMSTIAERGKPEVIMPASASRVRTAEQMRQIMGESGAKSGGDNVTIVNNTTGKIDSATTERDDEGRLRIIISETVSSALQDSNSAISKSRRATRGQPGY